MRETITGTERAPTPHRADDDGTILIFLHIPKAAGTSLRQLIVRQYGPDRVCVPQPQSGPRLERNWRYLRGEGPLPSKIRPGFDPNAVPRDELSKLPLEVLSRVRVVMGHLWFGLHGALPRPSTYMTVFRDPVERVLSLYFYRTKMQGLTGPLEEYLDARRDFEIDNAQTRYLCGRLEGVDVRFSPCTPDMLELAKRRLLEHFPVVGIAERFDESLLLMARAFGWDEPFYERHNVNRERPRGRRVPERIRERIAELNRFDLELHRFASQLLDERLAAQDPPIDAEVVRGFRRANLLRRIKILRVLYPMGRPVLRVVRSAARVTRRSASS